MRCLIDSPVSAFYSSNRFVLCTNSIIIIISATTVGPVNTLKGTLVFNTPLKGIMITNTLLKGILVINTLLKGTLVVN